MPVYQFCQDEIKKYAPLEKIIAMIW